ncbi:hypothetical protein LSG31_16525 [Fodinisporobacter ferrooxydans]|uniref:Uncharacterized protein n=1 Tax=Fodinisporobacter ferrooxydans TaxID=2901836 RepID=A0ABY4CGE3_9BACL|nr:hypothetical protein LSG31_16525 [Alicyclobacillaceae bacterium MYW30-H2]
MALTNLPPIKPSKGVVFFMGAFLATFVFWFTRPKSTDEESVDRQPKDF